MTETNKTYSAGAVSQNENFKVPETSYVIVKFLQDPMAKALFDHFYWREFIKSENVIRPYALKKQAEFELKHARLYLMLLLRKIGEIK